MIEKEYTIQSYDTNPRSTLRFSSLLKYMQQAAREDCDNRGATYNAMRELGVVFVLVRSAVSLKERIRCGESITLRTWQHFVKGVSMYRDYVFERNGEAIGSARTQWVLVEYETRKIVRPSVLKWTIENYDENSGIEVAASLPPTGPFDHEYSGRVLYSLLDENNHLNNALYLDVLEDGIENHRDIATVNLHYVSELRPEENFTTRYKYRDDGYDAVISDSNEKTAFTAFIDYLPE